MRVLLRAPNTRGHALTSGARRHRPRPQAADGLAFRALDRADATGGGEAAAVGASLLRSYEEEQRLVQENAALRSQLEALRRRCENEEDWRRDAHGLQVLPARPARERALQAASAYATAVSCRQARAQTDAADARPQAELSQRDAAMAAAEQRHLDSMARMHKQLEDVSSDLTAAQASEARLGQQVKRCACLRAVACPIGHREQPTDHATDPRARACARTSTRWNQEERIAL